jgi:hypothetical protein
MAKKYPALLLATVVCLFVPAARAQYGNADVFYNYITGVAHDAGFDTGALPAVPTAAYTISFDPERNLHHPCRPDCAGAGDSRAPFSGLRFRRAAPACSS